MSNHHYNNYPLVVYGKTEISHALLYEYDTTMARTLKERARFDRLIESTIKIANLYIDEELAKITQRIRNDIRNATSGTTSQYELDSIPTQYHPEEQNEQLYNAQTVLLKSAYRKLATIAHPDKGGDKDLFAAIATAYKNRDLGFLTETYMNLVQLHDLFWKQSWGVLYSRTEVRRPAVKFQEFQTTMLYAVNRLHTIGRKGEAQQQMKLYQMQLNVVLTAELNHIQGKNNGQGQQEEQEVDFFKEQVEGSRSQED